MAEDHPDYDNNWLEEILKKHHAKYSMVLYFETSDPNRVKQVIEYLSDNKNTEYAKHQIYFYDPWTGLGHVNRKSQEVEYGEPASAGSRFSSNEKESRGNPILIDALKNMDKKLKDDSTIFILSNIIPSSGKNEEIATENLLISALRSWATSNDVIRNKSLIILIGSSVGKLLDEETRSLMASIEVDFGSNQEYENIVAFYSKEFRSILKTDEEINRSIVARSLKGLNLHQAEAVLEETCIEKRIMDLEEIKKLKGEIIKNTGILEVEDPENGFAMIGGYKEVKDFITNKIIMAMQDEKRAKSLVIPLPRGILLFGPPGTGKTLFAKAIAKEVKYPFINMKTENIYSQWLGESGQRMKNAIRTAEKMSPAIVFIDEIDRFGKRTESRDSAGEETRRVFSQMLEWLGDQKRQAIIIGTTNVTKQLDPAFIRTGRFDYRIPIFYPDDEARLDILRIHAGIPDDQGKNPPKAKPPYSCSDIEMLDYIKQKIVPKTNYFSGAELEELVNRAKRNAFERKSEIVTKEDFLKSLELFRVDQEARGQEMKEEYLDQANEYCDDTTFIKKLEAMYAR